MDIVLDEIVRAAAAEKRAGSLISALAPLASINVRGRVYAKLRKVTVASLYFIIFP
jgi:hypothetical protein